MSDSPSLAAAFAAVDDNISNLERILRERGTLPLAATVDQTIDLAKQMMRAYLASRAGEAAASHVSADSDDVLDVFTAFVKGDPSLNAIRDNVRELVYYRNCIVMDRHDALPTKPETMAVRTARHIYLYLMTRATQEGRVGQG